MKKLGKSEEKKISGIGGLIYLTVYSGYTSFNTFIDIARNITFIYQHCQQYYNNTYSVQLGEVGVIQLYGNDPDMAK